MIQIKYYQGSNTPNRKIERKLSKANHISYAQIIIDKDKANTADVDVQAPLFSM